jgi:hypothetical protein
LKPVNPNEVNIVQKSQEVELEKSLEKVNSEEINSQNANIYKPILQTSIPHQEKNPPEEKKVEQKDLRALVEAKLAMRKQQEEGSKEVAEKIKQEINHKLEQRIEVHKDKQQENKLKEKQIEEKLK